MDIQTPLTLRAIWSYQGESKRDSPSFPTRLVFIVIVVSGYEYSKKGPQAFTEK